MKTSARGRECKTHCLLQGGAPLRCAGQMPVTLVSTKALFRELGIRTYFNDELVFVTSSGERIGFVETPVNYTVLFDDDPTTIIAVSREPIQPALAES